MFATSASVTSRCAPAGATVARQPDLRIPIADKLARLDQLLDQIAASWRLVTLGEAAAEDQRTE